MGLTFYTPPPAARPYIPPHHLSPPVEIYLHPHSKLPHISTHHLFTYTHLPLIPNCNLLTRLSSGIVTTLSPDSIPSIPLKENDWKPGDDV